MKKLSFSLLFFLAAIILQAHQPQFSTANFYELPSTGRKAYSMNQAWRFYKGAIKGEPFAISFDDAQWEAVNLPHGLEYLQEEASGGPNYRGEAWYRKRFTPSDELKGKKLFLHFEAIMGKSKVWINGTEVKQFFGGYLPVIVDISSLVRFGQENLIAVWADNSDDPTYPVGKEQDLLDFSYFGGIYRECWLIAHNSVYITNSNYENEVAGGGLFISYDQVSQKSAIVNFKAHVRNESSVAQSVTVVYELKTKEEAIVKSISQKMTLAAGKAAYSEKKIKVQEPQLWSPEHPYLYYVDVTIKDAKGKVIDGYRQRAGIRSIEFKQEQGLWINGQPYGKIMGTNRHQDFAVIGNALPNSLQWRDAKKLKDAGLKVIRTHYVIDPAFMDACDELGLFALVETPGWQFWGENPEFEEFVYSDIRNMIRIHRNHASLFFWEPVLNETHYPDRFAKNAADICKAEYPYPYSMAACDDNANGDQYFDLLLRPTANLRPGKTYFTREWGDNVDDWNAHNSTSRAARLWGEEPMMVQSRHYMNWYEKIYNQKSQVVGGCFWHSFDHQRGYHPDPFYGGIMDAYRQPKPAYYMFMSQRDTVQREGVCQSGPMIYIAHEMTPFSSADVTVYSNCEEVRLTVFENGKQYTQKIDQNTKKIPSPAFVFPDVFDFMACKALARAEKHDQCYFLAEGLINGKVVVSHKRSSGERPDHIRLTVDTDGVDLVADGSDVVTVIAEMVDKKGTVKRLNNSLIRFEIEGEGRLIHPNNDSHAPAMIQWGSAPILVQSTAKAGKIKVRAYMEVAGTQRPLAGSIEFNSVPNYKSEIFAADDLMKVGTIKAKATAVSSANCKELEQDNAKLRKELYEIKLKEVGDQQSHFGVGIND